MCGYHLQRYIGKSAMSITGLGLSRRRRCLSCPDDKAVRRSASEQWSRCEANGQVLSPEWCDDPTHECPLRHWEGLVAVDMESELAASFARRVDSLAATLSPWATRLTKEDAAAAIDQMVTESKLDADTALAVAERLNVADVEIRL